MPPLPSSFKAIPNQSSCSLMWKECQKFYLKDANRGPNTSFVVNDFLDNSNNNFFVIVMGDFLKCFKVTVMHCPTLTLQEHIIKNRFFDNPGIYLLHQVINEVFWSVLKFFEIFCGRWKLQELCGDTYFFSTRHWRKRHYIHISSFYLLSSSSKCFIKYLQHF